MQRYRQPSSRPCDGIDISDDDAAVVEAIETIETIEDIERITEQDITAQPSISNVVWDTEVAALAQERPNDDPQTAACRQLWCAVLQLALEDALGTNRAVVHVPAYRRLHRRANRLDARRFLAEGSPHAAWVCDVAGVDVGYLRRMLRG